MKTRTMTRTQAELLLAAVIIARSTSYVFTKVGLQDMGKFTLLAVRFLLAFAFLAALFRRRLLQIDRRTLLSGLAMGGIYFCVMTAELTALKTVETSTVSFVTNTAVVIVPLIQALLAALLFSPGLLTKNSVASCLKFHNPASKAHTISNVFVIS